MKKIILILMTAVFAASCGDNLENLNKNTKNPAQVSGESLYAGAVKDLADLMVSPNVNVNNNRLWVQHWQETVYVDESNYDQTGRAIPDYHWSTMYADVLVNLKDAAEKISGSDNALTEDAKTNKLAIIEILNVYVYSNLVQTFGNVPYTEALDIENTLPAYDDALTIYTDLFKRLDKAIGQLDPAKPAFDASTDLIYGGDVTSWGRFGNSLMFRMAMVVADAKSTLSKKYAKEALVTNNFGVFTNNAQSAKYTYNGTFPNSNPVYNELIKSGRDDYVGGEVLINMMNTLQDPRRSMFFDPNLRSPLGEVTGVSGSTIQVASFTNTPAVGDIVYVFTGPENETPRPPLVGTIVSVGANSVDVAYTKNTPAVGDKLIFSTFKGGTAGAGSPFTENSHISRPITDPGRPGTLLSNIEIQFLLAEAAARTGYAGVTMSAADYYKNAIKASFAEWGQSAFFSDYYATVEYTDALAASTTSPAWVGAIGKQAYIALFNRTFAPWLMVRRYDYPKLNKPQTARSGFPLRYTYPADEQRLNPDNWSAAASAIGGDEPETQLFWDENPPNWGW